MINDDHPMTLMEGLALRIVRMDEPNPYDSKLVQVQVVGTDDWISLVAIRGDGKLYVTKGSHSLRDIEALRHMGFQVTEAGGVELGGTVDIGVVNTRDFDSGGFDPLRYDPLRN